MESIDTTIVIPNEKLLGVAENAAFRILPDRRRHPPPGVQGMPTSSPSPASSTVTSPM
jgi:hypothetical protein